MTVLVPDAFLAFPLRYRDLQELPLSIADGRSQAEVLQECEALQTCIKEPGMDSPLQASSLSSVMPMNENVRSAIPGRKFTFRTKVAPFLAQDGSFDFSVYDPRANFAGSLG
jgi:hypothetical protein